jgi:hypothetical protein
MIRKLSTVLFLCAIATSCFGQCQTITSGRPRIYLNNPAYGSYSTVLARLQAAQAADSAEWQAIYNEATPFLTTLPASVNYDAIGMEMAMIYQVNTTTYAAYGARALVLMNLALQFIAPTVDITAATNSNPTVFTLTSTSGFSSGNYTAPLWGGTGSWAAFNLTTTYHVTVVDGTHISVAIDSTAFGAYPGNMTFSNNGFTGLNQARWDTPQMAAIWDWTHPLISTDLTADQINQIENTMAAAISYVVANPHEWTEGLSIPNPTAGTGNLFIGPTNGALQMAVAFSGDSVTGLNSQTICSNARTEFLLAAPIYETGGTVSGVQTFPLGHGGAYVQSTEYAPETEFYLLDYLEVMLGATGENLYPNISTFPTTALQFLYNDVSPGSTSGLPGGGSWGELLPYGDILFPNQHIKTLNEITREVLEQDALYLCSAASDSTDCAYDEWWLQNTFTEAQANTQCNCAISPGRNAGAEFLFYDPTLTATDPRSTYGTDYLADGYSIMLSRSAWTSSATWVGFKGGALRGRDDDHFHPDILSFEIYRNGDWLTTNLTQYIPSNPLTRVNNVPLPETNQFGTQFEGSSPPSRPSDNEFDWGQVGMTTDGSITQHEFNTTLSYAYAEANATTPYNGTANPFTSPAWTAPITAVIRDLLYLKPDTFVIEDRLAYNTSLAAEDDIQCLGSPCSVSSNPFTLPSLLGNNALNVTVVSPASPTITTTSPSTQCTSLGLTVNVNCPSQTAINVTSGNSVTSEQYFFVMQSGATGFTPLTVTTLTATNAIAAQFGSYVIGGMTDTSQTGVTRSYHYSDSGTIQHLFMGLAPSTVYYVNLSTPGTVSFSNTSGGGATPITTTTGGILSFTTSSSPTPLTSYSPNPVLFGSQTINCGVSCPTRTTTLTNSGTANLSVSTVDMQSTGTPTGTYFSVTNNCGLVTPGNSCTITATFDPTITGPLNDYIVVSSNAPSSPDLVPVSGTGTPPPGAPTLAGAMKTGASLH